jgi:hypothetical protein
MDRNGTALVDVRWVATCARRLRERWPHADPTSLEEAAAELWNDDALRAMPPAEAATRWLAPIGASPPASVREG